MEGWRVLQGIDRAAICRGGGLIVVLINKKEYTLKKAFTFETNKRYKFTVTVDKTNEGINVGIGNWEDGWC